jgi:hypothetical protein
MRRISTSARTSASRDYSFVAGAMKRLESAREVAPHRLTLEVARATTIVSTARASYLIGPELRRVYVVGGVRLLLRPLDSSFVSLSLASLLRLLEALGPLG